MSVGAVIGVPAALEAGTSPSLVHYLPIATTIIAAFFTASLVRRYRARGGGAHLLWWAVGGACYGLGTGLESAITLSGNTPMSNKLWYAAGAVLGAYPLAQGTAFLFDEATHGARAHLDHGTARRPARRARLGVGALLDPAHQSICRRHPGRCGERRALATYRSRAGSSASYRLSL